VDPRHHGRAQRGGSRGGEGARGWGVADPRHHGRAQRGGAGAGLDDSYCAGVCGVLPCGAGGRCGTGAGAVYKWLLIVVEMWCRCWM
jgi:hypothetical protein